MKKITCVMIVCAMLAVPVASWALPPVTLSLTCDDVYNVETGFNALGASLFSILKQALGTQLPYANWQTVNLENNMLGDGIPDIYQVSLLGAVLCAGDPGILAQYNTNKGLFTDFVSGLVTTFANAGTMATAEGQAGTDLLAWLDTAQAGAPPAGLNGSTPREAILAADPTGGQATVDSIVALAGEDIDDPNSTDPKDRIRSGLIGSAADIADFTAQYGFLIGQLNSWGPIFAALCGTSTEMSDSINTVVQTKLLPALAEYVSTLTALKDGCLSIANAAPPIVGIQAIIKVGPPPITMQGELTSAATTINGTATAMGGISLPAFEIYGVAKSASQPFSAYGDYNGNGDTNLQVYNTVVVHGNPDLTDNQKVQAFVAAASGASPFYPGNPSLPVASLLGLSLMAGACGLGGAFSIRKK